MLPVSSSPNRARHQHPAPSHTGAPWAEQEPPRTKQSLQTFTNQKKPDQWMLGKVQKHHCSLKARSGNAFRHSRHTLLPEPHLPASSPSRQHLGKPREQQATSVAPGLPGAAARHTLREHPLVLARCSKRTQTQPEPGQNEPRARDTTSLTPPAPPRTPCCPGGTRNLAAFILPGVPAAAWD